MNAQTNPRHRAGNLLERAAVAERSEELLAFARVFRAKALPDGVALELCRSYSAVARSKKAREYLGRAASVINNLD